MTGSFRQYLKIREADTIPNPNWELDLAKKKDFYDELRQAESIIFQYVSRYELKDRQAAFKKVMDTLQRKAGFSIKPSSKQVGKYLESFSVFIEEVKIETLAQALDVVAQAVRKQGESYLREFIRRLKTTAQGRSSQADSDTPTRIATPGWKQYILTIQHHLQQEVQKGTNPIKFNFPQDVSQQHIDIATDAAKKVMTKLGYEQAMVRPQVEKGRHRLIITYTPSVHPQLSKQGMLRNLAPKKVDEMIRQAIQQALEKRKHWPLAGDLTIEIPQPGHAHIDAEFFENRIAFFLRTEFKDHPGHPYEHDDLRVMKIASNKPGILRFHVEGMEKGGQHRVWDALPDETKWGSRGQMPATEPSVAHAGAFRF